MDFETLDAEILLLIMNPADPIPEKHRAFFKSISGFRIDRRTALSRVYEMWKYARENNAGSTEVADKFGYASRVSVHQAFRGFGIEFPKRAVPIRASKKVQTLYSSVYDIVLKEGTLLDLKDLYDSEPSFANYVFNDVLYLYHVFEVLTEQQVEELKQKIKF